MNIEMFLNSGGVIILILIVMSIAGMTVALRSFSAMRTDGIIWGEIYEELVTAIKGGQFREAVARCQENQCYYTRIILAGLKELKRPYIIVKETFESVGIKESNLYMRDAEILNVIGALSPMLGLLGTVLGMAETFNTIAVLDALGKPELLAGGISKALLTTIAGLCVAIPSLGASQYIKMKAKSMATVMLEECTKLIPYIAK